MHMKRLVPAMLAAAFLGSPAVQASDNETIFFPMHGRLVIPHLRLGNELYYVILNRTPNGTYNFDLVGATVVRITPQPGDNWANTDEIIGDWSSPDLPGLALGIFANGNFSLTTPAEEHCPSGTETGTWTFEETTGVFFAVAQTDANADCGVSPMDGAVRLERDGVNLKVHLYDVDNGAQEHNTLTLTPN